MTTDAIADPSLLVVLFCVGVAAGVVIWLLDLAPGASRKPAGRVRANEPKDTPRRNLDLTGGTDAQKRPVVYDIILDKFEDGGYTTAMRVHGPDSRPGFAARAARGGARTRPSRDLDAARRSSSNFRSTPRRPMSRLVKKLSLEQSIGFLYMYEGKFLEAALVAREGARDQPGPRRARGGPEPAHGRAGDHRHAARRDRELPGVRRPVELHFPDRSRGRPPQSGGLARGDPVVQPLPRVVAARPADPLALEHRLHDAGRVPRKGPVAVPDPGRVIPLGGRRGPVYECRLARRPDRAGAQTWPAAASSTISTATAWPTSSPPRSMPIWVPRCTSIAVTARSKIGRPRPVSVTRSMPSMSPGPTSTTTAISTSCSCAAPGKLRFGSRSCGTRATARFDDVTVAGGSGRADRRPSRPPGAITTTTGWSTSSSAASISPPGGAPSSKPGDPRNRCRLYHNRGNGTFVDVAAAAGVTNERCAKGSAWGDYDGDGRLDLFVSNMGQPCRLYHNEGDGKFRDVAPELGVTGTDISFACWFWDYDNDGLLDLYVNDYRAKVAEVLCSAMGVKIAGVEPPPPLPQPWFGAASAMSPRRSDSTGQWRRWARTSATSTMTATSTFTWVPATCRTRAWTSTSCSGTSRANDFEDITTSSGTGHLQKGHGVSFADWDCDGDLDLFVELGGATPGDQGYNALFQNPGQGHHWLKIKLVGTKTNRAALGARIRVELQASKDGQMRSISPHGRQQLQLRRQQLGRDDRPGRRDAGRSELTVSWPTSKTTQTFRDLAAEQSIEITEGSDSPKPIHQSPMVLPGR